MVQRRLILVFVFPDRMFTDERIFHGSYIVLIISMSTSSLVFLKVMDEFSPFMLINIASISISAVLSGFVARRMDFIILWAVYSVCSGIVNLAT